MCLEGSSYAQFILKHLLILIHKTLEIVSGFRLTVEGVIRVSGYVSGTYPLIIMEIGALCPLPCTGARL